jgi:hypothetical protein
MNPLTLFLIMLDESRRINENGSWDKYNARKNCRRRHKDGLDRRSRKRRP